jgi:hypothetical protein
MNDKIEISLQDLWEILSVCIQDQRKCDPEGMACLGERLFKEYLEKRK